MPFPGPYWMLAWAVLTPLQDDAPIPLTPYDREIVLELTAEDPHLVEGRGPTQVVEYVSEFEGTLHVWTSSELDLFLRVEDAADSTLFLEDDDSGGTTPYLRFAVIVGDPLAVLVAGATERTAGPLVLHLVAAPETGATREAATAVWSALGAAQDLQDGGDLEGARELVRAATFEGIAGAETSQSIADALWELGFSAFEAGEIPACHEAWSGARRHRERIYPENHPELLRARANLAISMARMGNLAGARALREAVLAGAERIYPEDHPDLLRARADLAISMAHMGDLAGARALREAVLAGYERIYPKDHPDLLIARNNLTISRHEMDDPAGVRALLPPLCDGIRARVLASLTLSPREARQTVAAAGPRLARVHFFSESAGAELRAGVFELTETMRLVAGEAARSLARYDTDPELAPILTEAASVRRDLNDLIAGAGRGGRDTESIADELTRLSFERDRLEREASGRLAERGVVTQPVGVEALAGALAALDPKGAAVGYRRLIHWYRSEASGRIEGGADHLLARVLRANGTLKRVDLGPAAELEELVTAWRASMGASLQSRGFSSSETEGTGGPEVSGAELRARLLDPVLAAAGDDVERLFVCADDFVFLVPLDALPLDEDGTERVGDRVRIVGEVSFARLLAAESPLDGDPALLALGGVDYGAKGDEPEALVETDGLPGTRRARPGSFLEIPQSGHEAEAIAELFEGVLDVEPTLLTGAETTKAALFEAAAGKRFVHLATHGWFAPDSVKSTEDVQPVAPGPELMSSEERVTGFAPMTLCGLALAGAISGRDSLGRVPGILTAEELCSLDLSQCELAVLSACETNVGIRRAGQGIQSLQAALYAAGARTSITSLWKVDDRATRKLMEVFYSNLWLEKMPKAEALWQAKKALRDEDHPPADWAGWILTGDPN